MLDIINYKEPFIRSILEVSKRLGFVGLIISSDRPDDFEKILELGKQFLIPTFPLLLTNKIGSIPTDNKWIVGYEASNEAEFRRAVRTPDISLVSVDIGIISKCLTKQTLNIVSQYHKFIEISLKTLLFSSPRDRLKMLWILKRMAKILAKPKIRLIFSSRASTIYETISIRQIRAILTEIGFKDYVIKRILKINPIELAVSPYEIQVIGNTQILANILTLIKQYRRAHRKR